MQISGQRAALVRVRVVLGRPSREGAFGLPHSCRSPLSQGILLGVTGSLTWRN